MTTILTVSISSIICHKCGAIYGLSDTFKEKAQQDGRSWHCPHCETSTVFRDSDNDELRKKVARLQTDLERKEAEIAIRRAREATLEQSRNACRGHYHRVCRRIKAGVCPCCNRTFQNLARHMDLKHSDMQPEKTL